jgi:DNA-binding NtrC family response regulator
VDAAAPVIVADLQLGPRMDGLALGQKAMRRRPDVGVIYATGHPDHLAGHLLGPRERYIVKPFASAALIHAVRRLAPAPMLEWVIDDEGLVHRERPATGWGDELI